MWFSTLDWLNLSYKPWDWDLIHFGLPGGIWAHMKEDEDECPLCRPGKECEKIQSEEGHEYGEVRNGKMDQASDSNKYVWDDNQSVESESNEEWDDKQRDIKFEPIYFERAEKMIEWFLPVEKYDNLISDMRSPLSHDTEAYDCEHIGLLWDSCGLKICETNPGGIGHDKIDQASNINKYVWDDNQSEESDNNEEWDDNQSEEGYEEYDHINIFWNEGSPQICKTHPGGIGQDIVNQASGINKYDWNNPQSGTEFEPYDYPFER